ncbi:DapH/DapD/GlmU-related protein [Runella sp. MFBS21]|uniref:DapH/DapD/GlmU-related protein n=1 Tax=Runella sp. MFBS21 TaxID=3034018 RepID=UPI0023F65187|nr:DapH/DapD/GlmU-related protein [Runella sp. MFBS21]MDF7820408.1 DapH/DapD/GlmU-related protein [Runella sp. MFBS21]
MVKVYEQNSAFDSPWTVSQRFKMLLWEYFWYLFCVWTPKPANSWRVFCLRLFGAKLYGKPFVHPRARIQIPWNLIMHDRACIGDRTNIYSHDIIEIGPYATVAQEVYVCTSTHAFNREEFNLVTKPIRIGANAFIGARAFILPGVTIGENAVIGALSLVTKDMPAWMVCAGHPCKPIKPRVISELNDAS